MYTAFHEPVLSDVTVSYECYQVLLFGLNVIRSYCLVLTLSGILSRMNVIRC